MPTQKDLAALPGLVNHRLPLAVVGLDADGSVIAQNHVATVLLRRRDPLRVVEGRLVSRRRSETATLHALVARACADDGQAVGGTMQIRLDGNVSMGLLVTPLRRSSRPSTMAAVVMVSDPRNAAETWESLLGRIYGLTPTERQVVLQLLEGDPIDAIARRRRITRNTCRTHVKRVFAKVGARSQADLVRVLLGGRPRVSRSDDG